LSYVNDFSGNNYKIAGFSVFRDLDRTLYQRSTYDLLDFFGDIGGIVKSVLLLGGLLIKPIVGMLGTMSMLSTLYYYRDNKETGSVQKFVHLDRALSYESKY
jgi:hypothetical protein